MLFSSETVLVRHSLLVQMVETTRRDYSGSVAAAPQKQSDRRRTILPALCLGVLLVWASSGAASRAADEDPPVFATVGGQALTLSEYQAALRRGVRARYYHGKVPEGEMARFQREVGEQLITHTLLLQEAQRQQLEPDRDWVQARLAGLERRYSQHPQWQTQRDRLMADFEHALEKDNVVRRLEAQVRTITPPTTVELRAYYRQHPEKFSEPERFRVSAILLKVDPSSPPATWEAARAEAADLLRQLRAGGDFAALARLHSGDASAAQGGDMGYLHRGMLGDPAQEAVDALVPGELSEPVTLLDGLALFRLADRPTPRLMAFVEARERVQGLWLREHSELAWEAFVAGLRDATEISVREEYYLLLPPKGPGVDGSPSNTL